MGGTLLMSLIRWMGACAGRDGTTGCFGAVAVPEPIGLQAPAVVAPGAGQWKASGAVAPCEIVVNWSVFPLVRDQLETGHWMRNQMVCTPQLGQPAPFYVPAGLS
jgi:hypothetical protein